jgi:RNA polymerase sigma-70 factor (ECF subfamily)
VTSTLADALAAGDPEAFAALYDRLAVRLFNTARTLTSAADAEDIVHDVFVELARSRQRLAGVIDLEAYVFTMLRHAVSRRRRRFAIDRKAVGLLAAERLRAGGAGESPPRLPDDQLAAAVAALPAEQREVIALKIDGGLTFAEIAAVTHTSLNTAASRYRYALEKLRASLSTTEVQR